MKRSILVIIFIFVIGGLVLWRQSSPQPGLYVALGDSIAAGYGLPAAKNASKQDAACGRSVQAYPAVVAENLNMRLNNAACSGATSTDLKASQSSNGLSLPGQLDAAFAKEKPALISLTVGANDVRWTEFILHCYQTDCGTPADTQKAEAYLPTLRNNLAGALADINVKSQGKPPRVVVTGYYNLVENTCFALEPNVTTEEVKWFKDQTAELNRTIKDTAGNYNFVKYASVDFKGHDLCSPDSWVQGIASAGALHPTREGQAAIAQAVTAAAK
jgi:lysophospholipase L1-like esterase